ncbi:hypothetical protein [Flavobacterium sp.]|uniref:hypothetical protein n=1 Tax=Flavobacterium sp. TaxID=239 RepID=UPI00261AA996|nr:hypothetical protein [Flavobacterium sp.]
MKKLILLLSIVLLASCSKSDDDSPKTLPLTYQNLAGKWNFKSVIKADGTVVPFVGRCSTQIDYIEAFSYGRLDTYNFYADCVSADNNGTGTYYIFPDNLISSGGPIFSDSKVTNLTANGFTIEYATPKGLGFIIDINDAKAIVFEKR